MARTSDWGLTCKDRYGSKSYTFSTYDEAKFAAIEAIEKWIADAINFTKEEWNEMIRRNKVEIEHRSKRSGMLEPLCGLPDDEYIRLGWIART